MTSEHNVTGPGVRIRVEFPGPGQQNIPEVRIEFAEGYDGPFPRGEVAKQLARAVAQGWAAAFAFVGANTEWWQSNALALIEQEQEAIIEEFKSP